MAGEGHRLVVEVGGEDADVEPLRLVAEQIGDEHRQRVGLLAGGAAGRPEAQLAPAALRLGDQLGQDPLPQVVEEFRIAEELGHLDQEAGDQALVLVGVAAEVADVVGQGGLARGDHPPLEPAHDRRLLVGGEVDAALLAQLVEEGAELAVLRGRRDGEDPGEQIVEQRPDALGVGDDVDDRGRERQRHPGEAGRLRVLDHDRAAGLLDLAGAGRPVRTGPGQDDGDQILAEDLGRRSEEAVDGGPGPAPSSWVTRTSWSVMVTSRSGGHDVDGARVQRLVAVDRAHRQRPAPGQDVGQRGVAAGTEVLGDDDRGRELHRQGGNERRERLDPARRGPDHDQLGEAPLLLRHSRLPTRSNTRA